MEEKAVLRVRDRISAALTVPYVRRAVWLMAGGLAGFLTARGLVFGKYAPFAAAGAAAAPFSTMWAVILGGAVGYLFPSPVDIPARYIAALLAVGAIRWSLSELKSIRDHPVFAPVTAFLPLLSTGIAMVFLNGSLSNVLAMYIAESFLAAGTAYFLRRTVQLLETHRETAVFDSGDMELCFGSSEAALADIEARAAEILADGKLPLLLGGEHLVTLGAVRAAVKKYPNLHIIHFDAHADLRDDYLGAKLSHACVIRRCHELVGDGRIHQFCIRSGEREEFAFAKEHTQMQKFTFDGLEETVAQLKADGTPVYFTIDLDCLDPAVFAGTGTPEAGGVSFVQLLAALRCVCTANVIGADVNELAPMLDASGVSTATACKVLRELLLALHK